MNSYKIMPPILPEKEVTVDAYGTPDWAKDLIVVQMNPANATEAGSLKAAEKVLDHYSNIGVNCIWICPVNEYTDGNWGYKGWGVDTISYRLTGTNDYAEGWKVFKEFVDKAHSKNIRIILDIISWGTARDCPLYTEKPEFYAGESYWDGYAYNWANEEMKEWFISSLVDIAVNTGLDGYRFDCEPAHAGYDVINEVRSRLLDKGRKILSISEHVSNRNGAFDMEQSGAILLNDVVEARVKPFLDKYNIVERIKQGELGSDAQIEAGLGSKGRFYTRMINCHDSARAAIEGGTWSRAEFGYETLFSPFIPIWYIGTDWNNTVSSAGLYGNPICWEEVEEDEHLEFFEDVKEMIKIRRKYSDLFAYYPEGSEFKDTNICKVTVSKYLFKSTAQPYARYAGNKAALIIPNTTGYDEATFKVTIPFNDAGIDNYSKYIVKDAETDKIIISGTKEMVNNFEISVASDDQRVIIVEGVN